MTQVRNICSTRYTPVNLESRPDDVIAMDPGILMTTYDTNGFCTGWGEGDMK